ncbi:MAG: tRNA lysidine(34) synthetase TilS [Oscillospiraceae bacterium]
MMITDFTDKYNMLPEGAQILCAVSGGADSVCLLMLLLELAPARRLTVRAAHYNHCLRGAESDRDEEFVKSLCLKLGVTCVTERGDVAAYAAQNGMGTEEAARRLRYDFLERTAERLDCGRIATAHTADDNAETMLMNLARGTGLRGLCGIPPVRGRLIRPILTLTRAEVEEYLKSRAVTHIEDSSNASDDYARNRVRHAAVPALRSVNSGFSANASRAAELLRGDEEFLSSLAGDFIAENLRDNTLPERGLAALPRPVSSRVIRLIAGAGLSEKHVDAILALAGSEGLGFADVPGMRVTRECGRLEFGAAEQKEIEPTRLVIGGTVRIGGTDMLATCRLLPPGAEIHSSLNTFFFNYERICGNISCMSRADGDKIRLAGRGCTKSLSDMFAEKKLTQLKRRLTPVFRDGEGVIAVYGFGVAERCAAEPGCEALRIEIETKVTG